MTTSTESLERKIASAVEQVLREHLAECEMAAARAMREAFRRASQPSSKPGPRAKRTRTRPPPRRRTPEEMTDFEERLYAAICAHPGETMAVIAPAVGATARELNRPAVALRSAGRVRSVGQRGATRYFPMGE